jgi:hypothetical protein
MKHRQSVLQAVIIGILAAALLFVLFGMLTAIIQNPYFVRMMPIRWVDYLFLFLTAMLSGIYVGLWHYQRKSDATCDYMAMGGTIGGVFAFGCAMCNQLLMTLLGATAVMAYFTPLQPIVGIFSTALLSYAIWKKWVTIRESSKRRSK